MTVLQLSSLHCSALCKLEHGATSWQNSIRLALLQTLCGDSGWASLLSLWRVIDVIVLLGWTIHTRCRYITRTRRSLVAPFAPIRVWNQQLLCQSVYRDLHFKRPHIYGAFVTGPHLLCGITLYGNERPSITVTDVITQPAQGILVLTNLTLEASPVTFTCQRSC